MKSTLRRLGAAPARVAATVVSLALALATLGVFAVPAVSTATLHEAAAADRLAHLTAPVTPLADLTPLEDISGLETLEGRIVKTVALDDGDTASLVGLDFDSQAVNLVSADKGRLPESPGEVLAHPDLADLGEMLTVNGVDLQVVGTGSTSARADDPSLYAGIATVAEVTGVPGPNLVLVRLNATGGDDLDQAIVELRTAVAEAGGSMTAFPQTRAEGSHPIDEDIGMISVMIGGLGIVAGVVALILLASTTNTLISERSHETAVMRALGGKRRALRRRLRRVALAMAAAGVVIGVPLGIAVSNVIARMVLVKFVGLSPGIAISWPVVAGSVAFAIVGARLSAGHAARRVTRIPLATALRDQDGAPFGRRWSDRLLARVRSGGLFSRMALRNASRRRARSLGVVAQAGAAVAAFVIVASMYTSVASFDDAEVAPWRWQTMTVPEDPGLPYSADIGRTDPDVESAIFSEAELGDWEVEVYGLGADTTMLETDVVAGSWLTDEPDDGRPQAVVTGGFAEFEGIEIGDVITVDLVTGPADYDVVGLHTYRSRAVFVERDSLAAELGRPGAANVLWSHDDTAVDAPADVTSEVLSLEQVVAEGRSARAAVLYIFTAIGVIVVAVSAMSLSSTLLVNLHERRHELAALRAMGGRRAQMRRTLALETVPLVLVGWGLGVAAGWAGAAGLIAMFEAADAVRIGFVFATAAAPLAAAAVTIGALLLVRLATTSATRRPPAAVLRTTT